MRDSCSVAQQRPITVREDINSTIEQLQRELAALVTLRDSTPDHILDMPQPNLARLAYPRQGF